MPNFIRYVLILTLLLDGSAYCNNELSFEEHLYQLKHLEGRASRWSISSRTWISLKDGDIVAQDTLLRLYPGASVIFSANDNRQVDSMREFPVFALAETKPIMVRLNPENIRDQVGNSFYANSINMSFFEESKDLTYDIAKAWVMTNSLFLPGGYIQGELPEEEEQKEVDSEKPENKTILEETEGFTLTFPPKGSLVLTDTLPTFLTISWKVPEGIQGGDFKVLLKEKNGANNLIQSSEGKLYSRLPIFHSGIYSVEVLADDRYTTGKKTEFFVTTTSGRK